ncbi:MAG: hypothetical protein ACTS7E_01755 [Arsenophonus sp. NC-CH8-MAG3]
MEIKGKKESRSLIARDRYAYVSNEILEELNAECVSRFLELIIDKEFIFYLNEAK